MTKEALIQANYLQEKIQELTNIHNLLKTNPTTLKFKIEKITPAHERVDFYVHYSKDTFFIIFKTFIETELSKTLIEFEKI